jgi:hypothetical protein
LRLNHRLLWLALLALFSLPPRQAAAHDDPVVTVRVLCNGFNVLDMDAVLGEISDSATLSVDRPVQGSAQIEAWVKEQMDDDLRIEIVDIGTPQRLPDGYTLDWTARLSRQDWRRAGIDARQTSNTVVIHNGRITNWTAALDSGASSPQSARGSAVSAPAPARAGGGLPELFGVPVTLVFGALVAIVGAAVILRGARRR